MRFKRQDVSPFATVNFPYWGLIAVGIASSVYHSTLKYHTQMGQSKKPSYRSRLTPIVADEMSMHLAMGCVLMQVFNFRKPPDIQKRNSALIIGGLTTFIVYHCLTDEFVLHVAIFFGLSVTVSRMTSKITKETVKDRQHKKKLNRLTLMATCKNVVLPVSKCLTLTVYTGTALFAYFLWNIDVHLCNYVTALKHRLGLPWGILLELHGWWHILTAISSYSFMAMVEFLTCPEHDESHGVGFAWPARGVLQDLAHSISPVSPAKIKTTLTSHANGSARKKNS